LSVIPIPRPRPGVEPGQPGDGKVPAIAWREYQRRLATIDELDRWFAQPMNLAIVTGAVSGVVAIDADDRAAIHYCVHYHRLPYTPWQTATSRGYHLFYRHPGVAVANRARLKTRGGVLAIDVRGDGGYVIAPGSVHASGAVYAFAGDWSREDVPLFSSLARRPPRPTSQSPRAA
jgi:hypothetical protein